MRLSFLLAALLGGLIPITLTAQKENTPIGGRSAALGNASVTFADLWSAHNNQAGMAYCTHLAAGVCYENRFLTKELGIKGLVVAVPLKKAGTFGFTLSHYGYSKYSEIKVGIAYAMSFGEKFSAGLQLDYFRIQQTENYGNAQAVTFEGGIRVMPLRNLIFGVHVFNPVRARLGGKDGETMPLVFRTGLCYHFGDKALLSIETEKDLRYRAVFRAGVEYRIAKPVYARIGFNTSPAQYCFGFGAQWAGFNLDLASSVHPVLGFSIQASVSYNIVKMK